METIGERISSVISHFCESKADFARTMGEKPNTVSNWTARGKIGMNVITKITTAFPTVNVSWLLNGEGNMINTEDAPRTEPNNEDVFYIPLLPISAQGGTLNDFVISVKDSDCEKIISPIKKVDFAVQVSGDSMAPEYPSGSQVLIKKINERAFIDWGKVYVLDTCNGTVIKKLMPATGNDPDKVMCVSINPEYPPFEINFEHIFGVYRVMMCMSIK